MRKSVWVTGCCGYEAAGVIHLLKRGGINARFYRTGYRLGAGDTLIICFSSAPLLGWWRYLKITQWVAYRYDIRLIVLCPDEVYRTSIICSKNTVAVNGERSCFQLFWTLLQAVQCCLPGGVNYCREHIKLFFLERASQALLIFPVLESDRLAAQRAYYRRVLMVRRLGFASLMKLKVFMAGFIS